MRILILGGTLFLGRAVVDHALAAGREVTLLNRGRTNPGLYPDVETIVGDRDGDLQQLHGRTFDAVVDTSGYFPRQVRAVVDALDANIGHYTFVSSVSAYADSSVPGAGETADLATVEDPSLEGLGQNYGGFKALSEAALDHALPGRAHHVRAGLIVGPHDNTGRFTYWVDRIAAGGTVLAPGPQDQPVQFIDVRDVARWILHAADRNIAGAINATGTPGLMTLESVLDEIDNVTGGRAELTWVDEEFLLGRGVKPWDELPLWLPPRSVPSHAGHMSRSNARALELGLELRPLADTISAIRGESIHRPEQAPPKDFGNDLPQPGLTPEAEASLLSDWETARGER